MAGDLAGHHDIMRAVCFLAVLRTNSIARRPRQLSRAVKVCVQSGVLKAVDCESLLVARHLDCILWTQLLLGGAVRCIGKHL